MQNVSAISSKKTFLAFIKCHLPFFIQTTFGFVFNIDMWIVNNASNTRRVYQVYLNHKKRSLVLWMEKNKRFFRIIFFNINSSCCFCSTKNDVCDAGNLASLMKLDKKIGVSCLVDSVYFISKKNRCFLKNQKFEFFSK